MYSILKTQKRSLTHKKGVSITSSLFVTNVHIFVSFSDCSCAIYFVNYGQDEKEHLVWEGYTSSIVVESKRLKEGLCALVCKKLSNIYVLEFKENHKDHTFNVELKTMQKSQFAQIMEEEDENGLMNTLGCQLRLHTFKNGCFIIQYFVYKDKKLILDCYKYVQDVVHHSSKLNPSTTNKEAQGHHWNLAMFEIDVQINGHFVIESINDTTGQLALYRQIQLGDGEWVLRVLSPFAEPQIHPHNPQNQFEREVRINLPEDKFSEDTTILQICSYIQNSLLFILSSKTTGKLRACVMLGLAPNMIGTVPQGAFSFKNLQSNKCAFLEHNFIKMLHVNVKDEIFYALAHHHQFVDEQIYFNSLIIGNLRTGNVIQKGYCSLRNIDFSPNYRYILDMPYEYDKICLNRTIFHIRLLLSKSSLYMFLIENNALFKSFSDRFKNVMIQIL